MEDLEPDEVEKPRRTDQEILAELRRICDQEYVGIHKQGLRKILQGEF